MLRTAFILAALILSARADSLWPQFRGPARLSTAAGELPPAGLDGTSHLLWRSTILAGSSSPDVVGDRIFLTGFSDGKLATFALKRSAGSVASRHDLTLCGAATGKLLYTKERLGVSGDCYVSPTIVGERIFISATSGTLLILDATATEKLVVLGKIDLGEYLAASPAIVDGKAYVRTREHLVALGAR